MKTIVLHKQVSESTAIFNPAQNMQISYD